MGATRQGETAFDPALVGAGVTQHGGGCATVQPTVRLYLGESTSGDGRVMLLGEALEAESGLGTKQILSMDKLYRWDWHAKNWAAVQAEPEPLEPLPFPPSECQTSRDGCAVDCDNVDPDNPNGFLTDEERGCES